MLRPGLGLGESMIGGWRAAYAAVCGLAVLSAAPALAEDCTLKQMASLDITDGPLGEILVPVEINGSRRLFLVDTGGVYSSVTEGVADELQLKRKAIDQRIEIYRGSDGSRFKQGTTVDSLKIGNNEAKRFPLLIERNFGGAIAGVLAPDLLKLFDVEFNFADGKMNLFSPEHCEGKVVYWSTAYVDTPFKLIGDHITFDMMLDGDDAETILDTGASTTFVGAGFAYQHFGLSKDSPGMEKFGDPADPDYRYRFKSLAVHGLAVNDPLITLLPDAIEVAIRNTHSDKSDRDPLYGINPKSMQLLLGTNVIRKLRLYIAYKEHMLYLTARDAK